MSERNQAGAVTFQESEFDGRGRRMKKVVTNSGEYGGTVVYLYDSWKIIETRDGSGKLYQQFIHGTQYIDELVMMRVKDKGDLYVHQDANWNVVALTDLGGSVVERYVYTPYGQVTVHQETAYGDRDGDGDVDATDKGSPGITCGGTVTGACRILDLDFDGDYDSADATLFDNLPQGLARHPGRVATAVDQPFGHQGLLHEPELAQYQNRARHYDPSKRRFLQRDRAQYRSGANLYQYVRSNPDKKIDPSGSLDWDSATIIGTVTYGGPCSFGADRLRVATDSGSTITDVYREISPPIPLERKYNCHGYTFGGYNWDEGPAGIGSIGAVNSTIGQIIREDGWRRNNCCESEIYIFSDDDGNVTHSGRIRTPLVTVTTGYHFDELASGVESKWGWCSMTWSPASIGMQWTVYGGKYKCYTKNPNPKENWTCCLRGAHEAGWHED